MRVFRSPFVDNGYIGPEPRTIRELNIVRILGLLLAKQNWWTKSAKQSILTKWKSELSLLILNPQNSLKSTPTPNVSGSESPQTYLAPDPSPIGVLKTSLITEDLIDYVLKELMVLSKSGVFEISENSVFTVGPVPETFISDSLIPLHLKTALFQHIADFEANNDKDWHPGSNDVVLDLVHPSLFCIISNVTLDNYGYPIFIKESDSENDSTIIKADRFQWLPSEFKINLDGSVKICSRINNLNARKYAMFVKTIGEIFEKFVPMFEKMLTVLYNKRTPNRLTARVDYDNEEFLNTPELKLLVPSFQDHEEFKFELKGTTLQVIVKIANIHLTPENPKYDGGSWHLEGTSSESIISTGIYYYDSKNITTSNLEFRSSCDEPPYPTSDNEGVWATFGLREGEILVQDLGCIETIEDRCIVFPNILQHHVDSFQLKDPLLSGHRKILAFFVVDPNKRVKSTMDVPLYQKEVVVEDLMGSIGKLLPVEVVLKIVDKLGGVFGIEKAKEYRQMLMDSRKLLDDAEIEDYYYSDSYFAL